MLLAIPSEGLVFSNSREREIIKIFTYMLRERYLGHYLSLHGKSMTFPLPQSHDPAIFVVTGFCSNLYKYTNTYIYRTVISGSVRLIWAWRP